MELASPEQEPRARHPARAALRLASVEGHEKPLAIACPAERSSSVPKNATCFIGSFRILFVRRRPTCAFARPNSFRHTRMGLEEFQVHLACASSHCGFPRANSGKNGRKCMKTRNNALPSHKKALVTEANLSSCVLAKSTHPEPYCYW